MKYFSCQPRADSGIVKFTCIHRNIAKSGGDNLCTNISRISSMAESQLYFHKV